MAKTKVLISWAVTNQLICAFVFAYAKSRFSHGVAHIIHVTIQQSLERELCGSAPSLFNMSEL